MDQVDHPALRLQKLLTGYWKSQALHVAAKLGLADALAAGPCSVDALGARVGAAADTVRRLLRALASEGVFAETAPGVFALTPAADLLRSDHPQSQHAFALMMGDEHYAAWGELLYSIQTGRSAFEKVFGQPVFAHLAEHPEAAAVFDAAMTNIHGRESGPIAAALGSLDRQLLVDVGGGNGSLLAAILERHPAARGLLFDLPGVIERARAAFANHPCLPRTRFEAGDFFASVPAGGDVYLMRHIVHDWEDEPARRLLANCRDRLGENGRVVVVETVLPPGNEPGFGKWLDLNMLVIPHGRERTADEYQRLFASAGLRLTATTPTAAEVSLIEGRRA